MAEEYSSEIIENIVRKVQNGNEKSFAQLFDYFFPKVSRHIAFRVPGEEVEDIVSDVFLKVVKKIKSYTPRSGAGFSSWIFRIANNTVIDFYRKKKEFLGIEDEENNFFAEIPDEENLKPDEYTNQQFDYKKMYHLLKKLPSIQRNILELKYLEGFSNFEIAKIIGKSEGNIRVIQLRALREMRQRWNE